MPSRRVHLWTAALLILMSQRTFAQDAAVTATVTDETKGVCRM